jgi:hypothetical protein
MSTSPPSPAHSRKRLVAGALLFVMAAAGWSALAQNSASPSAAAAAASASAAKNGAAKSASPEWKDLSAAQQAALKPLAANWQGMGQGHKRKWLELSKNYASLSPTEQGNLHSRMSSWASLSPQQRAQARLNFAENQALTDGLTPEQRKAQWQAYQLLSPEEKNQLAASSQKPAVGTATATKPTDPLKNLPTPQFGTAKVLSNPAQPTRKIAVAPHLQKSNSLMPQTTASVSNLNPSGGSAGGSAAATAASPAPQ